MWTPTAERGAEISYFPNAIRNYVRTSTFHKCALLSKSFSVSVLWIREAFFKPTEKPYVLEQYSNQRFLNLDVFLIKFINTIPTVGRDVTKVGAIS